MTWFKSDDSFWRHRKVRKLGKDKLAAVGLWTICGTWCADNVMTNVTDGFVPDEVVEQNGDTRHRMAKRLVAVGLWEEVELDGEHGYLFHDWPDYNPTKAEVEAEREKWRAKKTGQRKGKPSPQVSPGDAPETAQGNTGGTHQGSPGEFPDPIPVPVPVPSSGDLGGVGHLGNASAKRPPERCSRHLLEAHPGPCGACADARRTLETWTHANAARVRACHLCDADGRRWDPAGRHRGTTGPCDHRPTRARAEAS